MGLLGKQFRLGLGPIVDRNGLDASVDHVRASALHICGKVGNNLEAMARSGADCLELDWQVDLRAARTRVGSKISLKGNLHTSKLAQSTGAEVYDDARHAIEAAKPGGAFILSSGCALGRDTPPENIAAMARAARDFGDDSGNKDLD